MRAPLLLLLFSALPLQAQDTTVVPLPALEVTITRAAQALTRVPAAISILNRTDIQRGQPGIGIEEALSVVPGVIVNNRHNFALGTRISIRGSGARAAFGVRGIRVLMDGIPLTMPDGQANLNNVDLTSTGRIEVLRGAASMLYGNAAGGVVAFESEQAPPGQHAQVRAIAGASDMYRLNAKVGGGSEATRYLVSLARLQADGFREHSRIEQNNLTARVRHQLNDRAYLALTLSGADAPVALNPGSLPLDSARLKPSMAWPRNRATASGEASRQVQLGIEHGRRIGQAASFNVIAYGLTRTLENPLPFAYIELDRRAGGIRSALRAVVGRAVLTGGLDVELQADERGEFNNVSGARGADASRDQTDRIHNFAPFLRASMDLSKALTVTAGLRYDRAHFEIDDRFLQDGRDDSGARNMSALSPMAGLTYRWSDQLSTFASVSTAFQTPTTTELINNPTLTGGLNTLEPQRTLSFEAGLRAGTARYAAELAVYHSEVRDALVPFQVAGGEGREFFRNAGHTRQRGMEAAVQVMLHRRLRLLTSYNFSDFVFIDDGLTDAEFEGNQLPGVPSHHLTTRLSWTSGAWFVEPQLEHTGSYYAADSNVAGSRNAAVTVIDLRAGAARPLGRLGLAPFIGVRNVLDASYFSSVVINAAGARYFEPAPGRNLYIGAGWSTKSWP